MSALRYESKIAKYYFASEKISIGGKCSVSFFVQYIQKLNNLKHRKQMMEPALFTPTWYTYESNYVHTFSFLRKLFLVYSIITAN